MFDTNVILSALMFPDSRPAKAFILAASQHELVLCNHIINETKEKVVSKRPDLAYSLEAMLTSMDFEMIAVAEQADHSISDPNDQPILDAAISGNVDVIVSGDKHFLALTLDKPKVYAPAAFLETYSG